MVVVDSNILFSALLSKNSFQLATLLKEEYKFVAPNFLFTEIFKHKDKILKYSKLAEPELLELLNYSLSNIQFIPVSVISIQSLEKAIALCGDIDEKDTPFVALSIELNALFWTRDKKLYEGLAAKGFTQFFNP